jgi:SAM-dependent methyltransferase
MCNHTCIEFVAALATAEEITGKDVLESGSRDVNGSVRPSIEHFSPRSYVGTDLEAGQRVDKICNATELVKTFGAESFDVVVSTEMIEHVEPWREVISNFKRVLRPGGVLYITTRSLGFGYHGYPGDYWRYEIADMQAIFADMEILSLVPDQKEPGVFVKARKPFDFVEKDLTTYSLYSMTTLAREVIPAKAVDNAG